MPRLTLLLILSLLAPHTLNGGALNSLVDLLTSNSGWEIDPNGSPTSPDPSGDRGWEIDPNG